MSDLERYDPTTEETMSWGEPCTIAKMWQSKTGEYVEYKQAANRIEQLERENEEANGEIASMSGELGNLNHLIQQIQQENQELAAHVERIGDEVTCIINDSVGVDGYHRNGDIASWDEFEIIEILARSPQTSLAEVKAKAVEGFIGYALKQASKSLPASKSNKWTYYEAACSDISVLASRYVNKIRSVK
jgi:TolA-binding protein